MAAIKNNNLMEALNSSFMNIPDGEGVVLASKILKTPLKEKVPECVFVQNLLGIGKNFSVYLLGASYDSVSTAAQNIMSHYPNISISGFHDGFFGENQEKEIIDDINIKKPDLIIIGLGAPKQELFIYRHSKDIRSGLAIGAGGTIDIISGFAKRAQEFCFCCEAARLATWLYGVQLKTSPWERELPVRLRCYWPWNRPTHIGKALSCDAAYPWRRASAA